MKKVTITTVAILIATLSFAQKMQQKNIPTNVLTNFKNKYPAVTKAKWDKEADKYEASFIVNNVSNSVLFDAKGNIAETEEAIELSQLPNSILPYVKTNYKGKKIKGSAKIIDAKGTLTYEVEIKDTDVIFDSNGKFIKELKG